MAECSAYLWFVADSTPADKPASAEAIRDKARAWELAGKLLLSMGSSTPTEKLASGIMAAKKNQLRAIIESNGAAGLQSSLSDFQRDCQPLVPMQEALIDQMRQGLPKTN